MSATDTESVLEHHLATFGDCDLEGIMEDYADDAVVITQSGTFRGHDEIRELFSGLFDEFSDSSVSFSLEEDVTVEEYAYIVWNAETPENEYEFATDTFVIRDGAIVAQTFGAKVSPK